MNTAPMFRMVYGVVVLAAAMRVMGCPVVSAETVHETLSGPSAPVAGYIFGVPVPVGNYRFAKQVSYMFPRPWEEGASETEREQFIWEALILHYESFRRNITVSEEELGQQIDAVLKREQQSFTRAGDPAAYAAWVTSRLNEEVPLFENQMRYVRQIDKLKDHIRGALPVTVTEEEMRQEFLNEQHHIGGEIVTFDAQAAAQAFLEQVKDPADWERMKQSGRQQVRPVSLMTLEAYMDLWGIPKDQLYAFHAMPVGSVGGPMPFGKQWCVYRLLEKRTGDPAEFPSQREAYFKQLKAKKQYEGLKRWIDDLTASAHLTVVPSS